MFCFDRTTRIHCVGIREGQRRWRLRLLRPHRSKSLAWGARLAVRGRTSRKARFGHRPGVKGSVVVNGYDRKNWVQGSAEVGACRIVPGRRREEEEEEKKDKSYVCSSQYMSVSLCLVMLTTMFNRL